MKCQNYTLITLTQILFAGASYKVKYTVNGETQEGELEFPDIKPKPSGSQETLSFNKPKCNALISYTVTATGHIESKRSNIARNYVPCDDIPQTKVLTTGAIVGICILILFVILLLIFLLCLCLNRDHKEDSIYWRVALCKCNKKNNKSKEAKKSQQQRPPVEPIRTLSDLSELYAKPSVDVKLSNQVQNRAYQDDEDDDDGGFLERRSQNDSNFDLPNSYNNRNFADLQNNFPVYHEEASTPSITGDSTVAINTVGLPVHISGSFDYYPQYRATPLPAYPESQNEQDYNYFARPSASSSNPNKIRMNTQV